MTSGIVSTVKESDVITSGCSYCFQHSVVMSFIITASDVSCFSAALVWCSSYTLKSRITHCGARNGRNCHDMVSIIDIYYDFIIYILSLIFLVLFALLRYLVL